MLRSMKRIIIGTTTAGDTAPSTAPRIAECKTVSPSSHGPSAVIAAPSTIAGTAESKTTRPPTRCSVSRLSSNPARSKMTISAIRRRSVEAVSNPGWIQSSAKGPITTPRSSMPTRPGTVSLRKAQSTKMLRTTISARLTSMEPWRCGGGGGRESTRSAAAAPSALARRASLR